MFLQVDVYPNHDSVPDASKTRHVCLATAADKPGLILTIGRKATVVSISDKAVSREHALLTVKTTNEALVNKSDPHSPVLATTEKEIEACEASRDKCCAVYTNRGKLGSFIVQEHHAEPLRTNAVAEENESDDDATDDEEELPMSMLQSQAGMPALSNATKALVKDASSVTLRSLGVNDSYVLSPLMLLSHNPATSSRVIIQIGKGGSTIVLTRRPMLFILGSSDKAKYDFMPRLHQIDAHHISTSEEEEYYSAITHHVTPTRAVSPKQTTSWLLQRKIVHPDYLQALLDRSNPADALPEIIEPSDDGHTFWKQAPNPALRELWKSWTFLSYDQRDAGMESMVRAAGTYVIQVYELGRTVADQVRAMEVKLSTGGGLSKDKCFMLDSKSKKKITGELHKTLGIRAVSTKDVALFLTSGAKQPDGSDLPQIQSGSGLEGIANELEVVQVTTEKVTDSVSLQADAVMDINAVESPKVSKKKSPTKEDRVPAAKSPARKGKSPQSTVKVVAADVTDMETDLPKLAFSKKSEAVIDASLKVTSKSVAKASSQAENEKSKSSSPTEVHKEPTIATSKSRKPDYDDVPLTRQVLESSTSDGWLSAAPKGKKRKAYIRDKGEISEATGTDAEELLDVAPTVLMTGLVVPAQGQPIGRAVASRGANYKAFRKNSVPSPPRARVPLRVHITKVSVAELQAATQLEELEEQSRRADALFAGPARGTGGMTRRRR